MVFSSAIFLFAYLPIVWLVNRFLPHRVSNAFLCVASLFFYAWGEPVYVLLMIGSVLLNYFAARRMMRSARKKAWLAAAVALNLAVLFLFKYTDFAVGTLNLLPGVALPQPGILLPIGISFFTFQAMSYTIDVYRGVTGVQKSLTSLMLYVSFFPQLIAGPIVKYHDIEQMMRERSVTLGETAPGIRRFISGLSKKLLIANTLGAFVDAVYALESGELNMPLAWLAAVAYALQLYYDFSGYSDMAIGLGRMFGFTFKENFNYPYISASVQEFWRRWHISLSTWFKEYVYIPLGGNRKGLLRTCANKVAVFFLTGLWHGAQWTFVVWGLIHGLFLMLEQFGVIPVKRFAGKLRCVGIVYALFVAVMAFVLFRAESFAQALALWGNLFAGAPSLGVYSKLVTPMLWAALAAGAVGCLPWSELQKRWAGNAFTAAKYAVTLVLLVLCMLSLSAATHNPFIYFRF